MLEGAGQVVAEVKGGVVPKIVFDGGVCGSGV